MTTKSMVEIAWAEDMGQFLYHQDPETRKIKRSLEKIKEKKKTVFHRLLQNLFDYIYIYIYIYLGKTGNKYNCMKM